MNIQTLVLGGLIATLLGAAFHLLRGGNLGRLVAYIILSWIGFWAGQFIADRLGWSIISIGQLNLGFAVILSILVMILGYWIIFGRSQPE